MEKRTVLFVDDEVNVLNSLKRGLMEEDYRCCFAESAQEALKIMEKKNIAVIVTDMKMPGMDGLSLLKILKEKYPNTVRVVLSGYTQLPQIILAINQGDIFKFITKPWKIEDEFKPVIRQAIEYHELIIGKEEFKKTLEAKNVSIQNILKAMDDKLSNSKKDYENIMSFIDEVFNLIKRDICGAKLMDRDTRTSLELIHKFSLGYLSTIPSNIKKFKLHRLLDEITVNISKMKDFSGVDINKKNIGTISCYGNYGMAFFIIIFILKHIVSYRDIKRIEISANSKIENKVVNIEFIMKAENGNNGSSNRGPDDLAFLEHLINQLMGNLGVSIVIRQENNSIFFIYRTVFTLD